MGRMSVHLRDAALAAGVAVVLLFDGLSGPRTGTAAIGSVLLVASGLALAGRRDRPVAVLVFTGLCAVGYRAAGFEVFAVAYLVAVYSAVRAGRRVAVLVTSVAVLVTLPGAAAFSGVASPGGTIDQVRGVLELAWLIAAAAAGEALRQAERRADEAERTREEIALRRAGEERLHLARELHDSLTHQISVIKVHAEAAVHVAQRRGEPVPEALLAIREAGREASRELRATLEALRDDDSAPPRGLDHVPDLVRQVCTTGLAATLTVEGRRPELPTAVDRTAYRIVQESLTNVTRHAAAATASVRIGYRPGEVSIQVDDDGTAAADAAPVPGAGLLGMRERVGALGGRLRAGGRAGGGFTVRAELPVDRTG
ncbi:sensor histidine kinase [Paractinoplanes maris]|uniref:sensor histidine kinase n=1 Tax=Paractinoplanes maris TaxID=1734446 RepID=UPI002022907A|nr:histidine kinase [Actinoplanes maris]